MRKNTVTTSSPEMRITTWPGHLTRRNLSLASAPAFARGIMERYIRLQQPWPMAALVFRMEESGENVSVSYHTHIAPRLKFTLLQWRPGAVSSFNASLPQLRSRGENETWIRFFKAVSVSFVRLLAPEEIVSRLVARFERVETLRKAQSIGPVEIPYQKERQQSTNTYLAPPIPPVQRIVRRSATPDEPERSLAPKHEEVASGMPEGQKKFKAVPLASVPSIDINRLTDQIIQTIDRRIIAQRERMGRP